MQALTRAVDVLMPTLGMQGDDTIKSLARYANFSFDVIHTDIPGWSAAINKCLERHTVGRDVLIIDDDVEIWPETFANLHQYMERAEVFGFKLLFPDGQIQHDGGFVNANGSCGHIKHNSDEPSYVAYVTASLCYIKEEALDFVAPLKVWPGAQWEDVALCLDAWGNGMRVMYIPSPATHKETATKRHDPEFAHKFGINSMYFRQRYESQCARMSTMFGVERRVPIAAGAPSL